jgi:hypothetical protein
MNRLIRASRVLALAAAGVLAMLVPASAAIAIDRVVLKDGQTYEGEIVREQGGYVWIKTTVGGVPTEKMFRPSDIANVVRDAAQPPASSETPAAETVATPGPIEKTAVEDEVEVTPARPGVPRGAVLTLGDEHNGDMVGVYMVANVLERAIPVLEKEIGTDGSGVVVLFIHSGGGYGSEVQLIADVIHNEYKKRWRTVAWIETAISAAAMSAHAIEEIYFTSHGNYGACTGFYGSFDRPVEGYELEQALFQMEKLSARGGYNPLIMRAMQVQQPLSATIDENGEVNWYPDLSGEIIVNRAGEILTFNEKSAKEVKFSRGTADTLEDLAKLMGYQEIDWVGKQVKGLPYPVSRAEQMQRDFRKKVRTDEDNTGRYFRNYETQVQLAAGTPRENRPPLVGKARQSLETIKGMVRNNPAFARNYWGGRQEFAEWVKEQEKLLRELLR